MILPTLLLLVTLGAPPPQPGWTPDPTTRARLEALTPADATPYYTLAEDLADDARDPARRTLAEHLFVLAYAIDRKRDPRSPLAAQACRALADVAGAERSRAWLVALAQVLDPRQAPPSWLAAPPRPSEESEPYRVATALGLVRSGEGARARQLLDKPEVRAALIRSDALLYRLGANYGSTTILREAELWPCPECHNDRYVKRPVVGAKGVEYRVCPRCQGLPGPRMNVQQFTAELRFESWLLQGKQRSWAAQIAADHSEPLVEPDPEILPAVFGVDPEAAYYRAGVWLTSPNDVPPKPGAAKPATKPAKPGPDSDQPNKPKNPVGG